jgi:SanA protein
MFGVKRILQFLTRLVFLLLLMGALILILPRVYTALAARPHLYTPETVPDHRIAIVFGAGLRRDGRPTAVLRDRVDTAVELYRAGKVDKLLVSGDNRFENYNEPGAMRDYAIEQGVPPADIVEDFAGRRTYDTCYRARHIFGVEDAVLVTQSFHQPRALYLCNALGIPADGVPSDNLRFRRGSMLWWQIRETPATLVALWEVHVSRPLPVLGNPEPIFPSAAQ